MFVRAVRGVAGDQSRHAGHARLVSNDRTLTAQYPDAGARWCGNWKVELAGLFVSDVNAEATAGGNGESHWTRDNPCARIGDRATRRVHHVRGPTTAGALDDGAAPRAAHSTKDAEHGCGPSDAFQIVLTLI
jgi:hypothetical protein